MVIKRPYERNERGQRRQGWLSELGLRGKPAGASWDYWGERARPARQVGIIVKKQQDWQGGYRIRGAGAAGRIEAETAGLAQRSDGLGVK